MTPLATHLTAFLREYLPRARACSVHTCDAYAYSFQLLLCFAAQRCGRSPSALILEQLDAALVLAFLEHLETVRGNSPKTRNARLAAVKAFAHFIEYRVPSAVELRAWLAIRGEGSAPELFLSAKGGPLTRSGFEYILAKHIATAATACPSIASKRVSPHVLRHTCAMHTLQATHDVRKVALWLGHASVKSTEIYLRADPAEKLAALDAGIAPKLRPGRFEAPDRVLAMLRSS
jgi:site-specific recombinase XerD